ncbi:hypothetical protein FRC08_000247 [Ceratobasidium sp. 394]|nr:hypothetical protein FRC08_000247 [Ceratobasidium sp. 394]KAG9088730.1 hypothetical protein FS749_001941 [Ceratobasidium sp. UAMH 11750]
MFFLTILTMLVLVTILLTSPSCTLSSTLSSHHFLSIVQCLVYGCVVVGLYFACQPPSPSAFSFRTPRQRGLKTWKLLTKSFSLCIKHGLRFTSPFLPSIPALLFATILLLTPIFPALEVSVGVRFQVAQNLFYGYIITLDAHFVLQLFYPHVTISGALYECASKIQKLFIACFSRSNLELVVYFALSACYFLFRYIVSPFCCKVISPCAQLTWSKSLPLVYVVSARGSIILATLGLNLLAILLLAPLHVFNWLFTPRSVLPTALAAVPDNTTSKKRNVHASPIRSYYAGGTRRIRPTKLTKKAEHFVTPSEGPSTPATSDTEPASLVESPRSVVSSRPTIATPDTISLPATPRSDPDSARPAPPATFSSTTSFAYFINAYLEPPAKSEFIPKPEPSSQAVHADDDISALVEKLQGFKLDLESEAAPVETERPAVRSSIVCKAFAPSTNPGPVATPRSTLDAASWEKAVLEAWFLAVVAPGNFHDIYERNLKMLSAGHVAGRFARC